MDKVMTKKEVRYRRLQAMWIRAMYEHRTLIKSMRFRLIKDL